MEKKNENGKVQLKGQLKLYIQWPAIMALLLIAMDLWVYKMDHRAGILMAVFVLIYIIMVGGLYFYSKNIIMKDLVEFAAQYGIVQNTLLRELSIPYAILLDDGKAVWMNDEFEAILGGKPKGEAYISKYIPELNRSIFPKEDQQKVTMEVYYDDKEYQAALKEAFLYDEEAVIEQYIQGREFSCAVIDGKALPVIEIAPLTGFYDYKNKYQAGSTIETCPADLPKEKAEEMQAISEKVFSALRLKQYARMDFMMDGDGKLYCLEANTLPGMTPTSLIPQEAQAMGVSFEDLCEWIMELALKEGE